MKSLSVEGGLIDLPVIDYEIKMIPFDLNALNGLPFEFRSIAKTMLSCVREKFGVGYFTIHGKSLKRGQTLRRGGPHTDGNYEPYIMDFDPPPGGWKVGEGGPSVESESHKRQYIKETGGILLASNYEACNGWNGKYEGMPSVGGDCKHINLGNPFRLKANTVYYGNNHFIHESLPMDDDAHRVFVRITMPEDHKFSPKTIEE